jgi:Macrophage migration inhibitory factor (MIF)
MFFILQRISVTINGGLPMCRGGSTEPTVVVQIWSIGVFGKDKNPEYGNKVMEFFKTNLPAVSEKR